VARGLNKSGSLSEDAVKALQSGDIQGLINSHSRFAGWKWMADEPEDDKDADDNQQDSGDSGTDDDKKQDEDKTASGGDDSELQAELERVKKRMSMADARADKAEKRLREIDDQDKSELQKAQDENTALKEEVTTLRADLQRERLSNAFLGQTQHTWHKPMAALRLAQAEGYLGDVVDDDGTVNEGALKSALAKLVKDNEFLIKKDSPNGPSGEPAGKRSDNGKDDKAVADADRRRAPALNRRGLVR